MVDFVPDERVGYGGLPLDFLEVSFEELLKTVRSEINELKDRVVAFHEEKLHALELENERLRSMRDIHPSTKMDAPTQYALELPKNSQTILLSTEAVQLMLPANGNSTHSLNNSSESPRCGGKERPSSQSLVDAKKSKRQTKCVGAERTNRTKKLFSRLALEQETMSAERLHNILRMVHGLSCPMNFERVQETLDNLCNECGRDHPCCLSSNSAQNRTSTKTSSSKRRQTVMSMFLSAFSKSSRSGDSAFHGRMDCSLFMRLMDWDTLYASLDENLAVDCYVIRDALIKHGADLLICFHARLELPSALVEKPFVIKVLDPLSALVILLNSLTIGLSSDIKWSGWTAFELAFTVFFTIEITLKMYFNGVRTTLCGADRYWNYFDILLVGMAIADALIQEFARDDLDMRDFTVARLARLAKVTRLMRLLRLLRLRIFKELLLMVRGVLAGLRTLFWAVVLLLFFVYSCSIALMETVGEASIEIGDKYETVLFQTLLWSMFNVFRCLMSDGSLPDGTPIVGHLEARYGASFVLPYTFAKLFIVFGILNLISAIFVENVLASARAKRELTEDGERVRVALALRRLLLKFCGHKSMKISCAGVTATIDSSSTELRSLPTRIMKYVRARLKAFSDDDEYRLQGGHEYF